MCSCTVLFFSTGSTGCVCTNTRLNSPPHPYTHYATSVIQLCMCWIIILLLMTITVIHQQKKLESPKTSKFGDNRSEIMFFVTSPRWFGDLTTWHVLPKKLSLVLLVFSSVWTLVAADGWWADRGAKNVHFKLFTSNMLTNDYAHLGTSKPPLSCS